MKTTNAYDEVDVTGGGDHLGDATELLDPYPLTKAAQSKALTLIAEAFRTDPEEAAVALALYAGMQTRHGLSVRPVVAPEWSGNTFQLTAGVNSFQLADEDPYRTLIVVRNQSDGEVYVANSPGQLAGPGSILLPARDSTGTVHELPIRSTAPVWLWTDATYVATNSAVVTWYIERAPVT